MKYNLIFRVDSSNVIGSGRFMRCYNLALELKHFNTTFICRYLNNEQRKLLEDKKIRLLINQTKSDQIYSDLYLNWLGVTQEIDAIDTIENINSLENIILIVDSYSLSETWLNLINPLTIKTIVIDDLANRNFNCDMLIDHNYFKNYEYRYHNLVNENAIKLLGPKYSLISKSLVKFKKEKPFFNHLNSILIYFGASDNYNLTLFTLDALLESKYKKLDFKIILRSDHKNFSQIEQLSNNLNNIELFSFTADIGDFFKKCDLAIGAGGTTTWERILVGIPSLIVTIAENQNKFIKDLKEDKFIYYLGNFSTLKKRDIIKKIDYLVKNKSDVAKNINRGQILVDGKGISRVKESIMNFL